MGDGPSVSVVRVFPFTQTPELFSRSHETRFVTADSDTKLLSDNSTGPLPFHAPHFVTPLGKSASLLPRRPTRKVLPIPRVYGIHVREAH